MKRVGLLRHAQAEARGARSDIDRVLSPRGWAEMEEVAGHLNGPDEPDFDLALVSPAQRTRETWDLARRPEVPVRFERAIYDAPVEALLDLLGALDDGVASVIVVGHNPGIEEFAAALLEDSAGLPGSFPTAGLALVALPIDSWVDLPGAIGTLERFYAPS